MGAGTWQVYRHSAAPLHGPPGGPQPSRVGDDGCVVEMTREDFEMAVSEGLDLVPADLAAQMDNVVVLVEDDAPVEDPELLGLYEGVPLTERDHMWAAGALPDRITIFRNPTLAICDTRDDVVEEVAVTVVHEIAHHFGIDDDRLHELGWA
jgi:predicted Zn-dependent protease with MMP-like domain